MIHNSVLYVNLMCLGCLEAQPIGSCGFVRKTFVTFYLKINRHVLLHIANISPEVSICSMSCI